MSQPKCPKCGVFRVCPECGRVDSTVFGGNRMPDTTRGIQYPRVDSSVYSSGFLKRRSLPPKIEKRRNIEHQVKKPKKWSEMDEYERESKFADYLGWFMLIAFLAAMLIGIAGS